MPPPLAKQPVLCRLRLHHKWERVFNPDGEDYLRCSACGKDRYDVDRVEPKGGFGGFLGGGMT